MGHLTLTVEGVHSLDRINYTQAFLTACQSVDFDLETVSDFDFDSDFENANQIGKNG